MIFLEQAHKSEPRTANQCWNQSTLIFFAFQDGHCVRSGHHAWEVLATARPRNMAGRTSPTSTFLHFAMFTVVCRRVVGAGPTSHITEVSKLGKNKSIYLNVIFVWGQLSSTMTHKGLPGQAIRAVVPKPFKNMAPPTSSQTCPQSCKSNRQTDRYSNCGNWKLL